MNNNTQNIKDIVWSSNAGFSILESLVASAVFAIIISATYYATKSYDSKIETVVVESTKTSTVSNVLDSVSSRGNKLQVDYSSDSDVTILSKDGALQMAWDSNGSIMRLSDCKQVEGADGKCALKGRYGYVVKQYTGYRGLYVVTLRFSHPKLFGSKQFIDYKRIIRR